MSYAVLTLSLQCYSHETVPTPIEKTTNFAVMLRNLDAQYHRIAGLNQGYERSYADRSIPVRRAVIFTQKNQLPPRAKNRMLRAIARLMVNPERDIIAYRTLNNPLDVITEFIKHPNNNHIVSYRMAIIFLVALRNPAIFHTMVNYQPQWMTSLSTVCADVQEEAKQQGSSYCIAKERWFIGQEQFLARKWIDKTIQAAAFTDRIKSLIIPNDLPKTSRDILACLDNNDKKSARDAAPVNIVINRRSFIHQAVNYMRSNRSVLTPAANQKLLLSLARIIINSSNLTEYATITDPINFIIKLIHSHTSDDYGVYELGLIFLSVFKSKKIFTALQYNHPEDITFETFLDDIQPIPQAKDPEYVERWNEVPWINAAGKTWASAIMFKNITQPTIQLYPLKNASSVIKTLLRYANVGVVRRFLTLGGAVNTTDDYVPTPLYQLTHRPALRALPHCAYLVSDLKKYGATMYARSTLRKRDKVEFAAHSQQDYARMYQNHFRILRENPLFNHAALRQLTPVTNTGDIEDIRTYYRIVLPYLLSNITIESLRSQLQRLYDYVNNDDPTIDSDDDDDSDDNDDDSTSDSDEDLGTQSQDVQQTPAQSQSA